MRVMRIVKLVDGVKPEAPGCSFVVQAEYQRGGLTKVHMCTNFAEWVNIGHGDVTFEVEQRHHYCDEHYRRITAVYEKRGARWRNLITGGEVVHL